MSTGFYNITAKNSSGCVSLASTASVGSGLSRGTQTEPASETSPVAVAIPTVTATPVSEKPTAIIPVEVASDLFEVSTFPNPTTTDFRININSAASETIRITVYDIFGRRLKYFSFGPKQSINLGQDLKAGVYLVEARQGENMKALKLVKF